MRQQVRLTEKQLPSIGSINLLNSSRQVNCVALSETGNLLTIGLSDSSVKVFWLSKASLMRSLGMGECNPFLEQEPTQVLNQPFTVTSQQGMIIKLYADQFEDAGLSASSANNAASVPPASNATGGGKRGQHAALAKSSSMISTTNNNANNNSNP